MSPVDLWDVLIPLELVGFLLLVITFVFRGRTPAYRRMATAFGVVFGVANVIAMILSLR